jgi:hypothetical protein
MTDRNELARRLEEVANSRDNYDPKSPTFSEVTNLLRQASSALSQNGWLPIESAPKDSKSRLVWCPAWRNTYLVSWIVPLGEEMTPDHSAGYWSHFAEGGTRLNQAPTHWQPLPPPPKSK